ncbi:MAG: hypothetical protein RL226_2301 [Bacteroidota bacterium]
MFIVIALAILGFVEIYSFKSITASFTGVQGLPRKTVYWLWWVLTIISYAGIIMASMNFRAWRSDHPTLLMAVIAFFFVLLMPKLVLSVFHVVDDLRWLVQYTLRKPSTDELGGNPISRATFITTTGQVLAGFTFVSFLYGVTKGKFDFRVLAHKVPINNLPDAFNGLKVVQISDAHLGSFNNAFDDVAKGIELINSLNPDVVLFTGDLVNVESSEAEPWIPVFKKLQAKIGVYSILGNHDYADYGDMTEEERNFSRRRIIEIHREMGMDILLNENRIIEKNGEKLALIGVENWGKGFKQQGDLSKAMQGVEGIAARILMSHDPTHWEEMVRGKEDIQLTLSGHTHGMQMGVEIPWLGLKLSPARFRYKYWGGLYTENTQHLHVNRGFGFLGFPGRVGMAPEITLLELQRG